MGWFVAPVMLCPATATPLDESNFAVTQRKLTESDVTFEVHRFGHWATDFEIILVAPQFNAFVRSLENALADYPILDEHDYSEREWDAACEGWRSASLRERVALSKRFGFHLMSCRRNELPVDEGSGELITYLAGA